MNFPNSALFIILGNSLARWTLEVVFCQLNVANHVFSTNSAVFFVFRVTLFYRSGSGMSNQSFATFVTVKLSHNHAQRDRVRTVFHGYAPFSGIYPLTQKSSGNDTSATFVSLIFTAFQQRDCLHVGGTGKHIHRNDTGDGVALFIQPFAISGQSGRIAGDIDDTVR